MKKQDIKNNHFAKYLKNISVLEHDDRNLKIEYQEQKELFQFLNLILSNHGNITLERSHEKVIINIESDFAIINDDSTVVFDDTIKALANIILISSDVIFTLSYEVSLLLKVYTDNYQHILNYLAKRTEDYYLLAQENISRFQKEIIEFNKLISVSNVEIDEEITDFTFDAIYEYYKLNMASKLVVIGNPGRMLLILGAKKMLYRFSNYSLFDRVYLLEVIKMYAECGPDIHKEDLHTQCGNSYYNVNDELYILNLSTTLVDDAVHFLHVTKGLSTTTDLDEESSEEDSDLESSNKTPTSSGYINILLISLVITILTVVVCFLRLT